MNDNADSWELAHAALILKVEEQPLHARQQARDNWLRELRNGTAVVRVRELRSGSLDVPVKLWNTPAIEALLTAALVSCRCPRRFAKQAWKKLSAEERANIERELA